MEVPMTMTTELKLAIEQAGSEPVRVEDPETHTAYVVIKEELYRRIVQMADLPNSDLSLHEVEEFIPLK
jgi:hypothetical protein